MITSTEASALKIPMCISPNRIGLPTGGAVIDAVDVRMKGTPHWRVTGRVLSLDPQAEPITFRILLPQHTWNRRLLHIGGGGFDGTIPFMGSSGIGAEMWHDRPNPIAQGYVVFGSDSGHTAPQSTFENWTDPIAAEFSLNDEMLANYAHEHIKKVKDVAYEIAETVYGCEPLHVYFAGTSNGGRCALLAAQRYPDDYDGIICGYPAIQWIPMVLHGLRCAQAEQAAGEAGWISPSDWIRASSVIEGYRLKHSITKESLSSPCGLPAVLRSDLLDILRPEQVCVMDICAADLDTVYLDDPYFDTYPGFAIAQGEPLRDDFNIFAMNGLSSAPVAADGMFAAFPTAVLRYQVLRKADFDMDTFDPYEHLAELRRACRLLNASNPDLDAFIRRGGKAILYHGTYDQLISVRSTIQYYDVLQKRYGSFLHQSLRCYVIPGAGHSLGVVDVGADMLKMLDNWVVWNDGPNELRAIDRRTNNPLHSIEL